MLEKKVETDKIEILSDGTMQIRERTIILEDGKIIDYDVSQESDEIKSIANIIRTKERIEKYQSKIDKLEKNIHDKRL